MKRTLTSMAAVAVAVTTLFLAGCGGPTDRGSASGPEGAGSSPGTAAQLAGSITVSAATSLAPAFGTLADGFSAAHPGADLTANFDASSALATQILEGAPADVYASADEVDMARLADAGLVRGEPAVVATNGLVVVTRPGNPEGIRTLADLAELDAGVIALCGEEVPCGRYAAEALEEAGVTVDESVVTRGQNVGATLTAVAEGDAVAGIVYATDARAAGDRVASVPIPPEHDVVATYVVAVLTSSDDPELATAFLDHVLGDEGRAVLAEHGFRPDP